MNNNTLAQAMLDRLEEHMRKNAHRLIDALDMRQMAHTLTAEQRKIVSDLLDRERPEAPLPTPTKATDPAILAEKCWTLGVLMLNNLHSMADFERIDRQAKLAMLALTEPFKRAVRAEYEAQAQSADKSMADLMAGREDL